MKQTISQMLEELSDSDAITTNAYFRVAQATKKQNKFERLNKQQLEQILNTVRIAASEGWTVTIEDLNF